MWCIGLEDLMRVHIGLFDIDHAKGKLLVRCGLGSCSPSSAGVVWKLGDEGGVEAMDVIRREMVCSA